MVKSIPYTVYELQAVMTIRIQTLIVKIYAIFGTVTECALWKKTKAQKNIQIDAMLRSEFSPENALGPEFWNFFEDSRIRVYP